MAKQTEGVTENLWDIKRCAEFVGCHPDYFRRVVRFRDGAPKPLDRPGRPRWLAEDWRAWARKLRGDYANSDD